MTKLSPIVSEFETEEQAEAYDRWFRAKAEASLADRRALAPHDEVMAEMRRMIADIAAKCFGGRQRSLICGALHATLPIGTLRPRLI